MHRASRALALSMSLASFLSVAAGAPTARARDARPELAALVAHLRARGAGEVREVARTFLFSGQSSSYTEQLAKSGCVAYLALGRGEVRDVDLGLYTDAGQLIADDVASAPYAYVRVCGAAGLTLHAGVSLFAGRGELILLRVDDAPRELGRLPEVLALAVGVGGSLEELRAVGVAADEVTVESSLSNEERSYRALGYEVGGVPLALELRGGAAFGQLSLGEAGCARVSATVPHARGVALELEGPSGTRWSARSGDDRASIALCGSARGHYVVRVQARSLRGIALVRAFGRRDVPRQRIQELGEASALAVAEAETLAAARGLRLAPLGSAWVEGETQIAWPVVVPAPGCYALAAVSEVGALAVDIRLTSEAGVLLAHNEGRRGVPMVFFCAPTSAHVRLVLRARGPDLRVSIWLGRSDGGSS